MLPTASSSWRSVEMLCDFHSMYTARGLHFCFGLQLYFMVLFVFRGILPRKCQRAVLKVCHFTLLGCTFKPVRSLVTQFYFCLHGLFVELVLEVTSVDSVNL